MMAVSYIIQLLCSVFRVLSSEFRGAWWRGCFLVKYLF